MITLHLGAVPVVAVYRGTELIWQPPAAPPPGP